MPFRTDTYPAGLTDAVVQTNISPGVLTDVCISVNSSLIRYGDLYATVFVAQLATNVPEPYYQLTSGILMHSHPLAWFGNLTIDEEMQLVYRILGYAAGTIRLAWNRKTTTNIKETGIYERSLRPPSA